MTDPGANVPIQVHVGLAIKAERLRRGWTQAVLAERIGISEQGLSKIERGESVPTLGTLESVAAALSLPIRRLFPAPKGEADARDDAARRVMALLAPLSRQDIERVEAVVAAMVRG
jgi:transcriptional regulator with XRE-family HTH domain